MPLENLDSFTANARRYAFSPDWAILAAPKDDGSVLLFGVASGERRPPLKGGFAVGLWTNFWTSSSYAQAPWFPRSYFGFSADGRFLIWNWGKKVVVWEVATRQVVFKQEIDGLRGNHVHVSPDGRFMAWSTSQGLTLWDVAGNAKESPPGNDVCAFSPDGRLLALVSEMPESWKDVRRRVPERKTIWDLARKEPQGTYEGICLSFSPDGRFLLTTNYAEGVGGIRLWEVDTSRTRVLSANVDPSRRRSRNEKADQPAWSPDGRFLAFLDSYANVEVWDLQAEVPAARILPMKGSPWDCSGYQADNWRYVGPDFIASRAPPTLRVSPDGRVVCIACINTNVWDLSRVTPELMAMGRWAVLSRDGRTLAHEWRSHDLRGFSLWDVAGGRTWGPPFETGDEAGLEFSPDGGLLATAGPGRSPNGQRRFVVHVWSVEAIRSTLGPSSAIRGLPDGGRGGRPSEPDSSARHAPRIAGRTFAP